ncbi:MAG: threonine/serine exporter family protein [Mariniphaga sp.]
MNGEHIKKIKEVEEMLLDVGTLLMSNGASTGRVRTTVNRIAEALGYEVELLITSRSLMLTVTEENGSDYTSSVRRTPPHGVNFKLVSGISRMSWRIIEDKLSVEQINQDLSRLRSLPHYPRLVVLSLVALAGASFCRLFGGDAVEMIVAFVATFVGLFIRQEAIKKRFNPYLAIVFASFAASMISGLSVRLGTGNTSEHALATSVLFLIPGVPFINSLTDLLDGNTLNGIVRGVNGFIIAFSIAFGLMLAMKICGI